MRYKEEEISDDILRYITTRTYTMFKVYFLLKIDKKKFKLKIQLPQELELGVFNKLKFIFKKFKKKV